MPGPSFRMLLAVVRLSAHHRRTPDWTPD